jgi:hypothetical protein
LLDVHVRVSQAPGQQQGFAVGEGRRVHGCRL